MMRIVPGWPLMCCVEMTCVCRPFAPGARWFEREEVEAALVDSDEGAAVRERAADAKDDAQRHRRR